MKCAAHPEIETNLTCGRCGIPICARCLVHTPVGGRCLKCAGLKRLPTYEIGLWQYLKAFWVGLGVCIILGVVWHLLWGFVFLLNFLLAAGVGYAVSEALSLLVNRKRGSTLAAIGGLCVVVSYIVASAGLTAGALNFFVDFRVYDLLVLAVGLFVAVTRLH